MNTEIPSFVKRFCAIDYGDKKDGLVITYVYLNDETLLLCFERPSMYSESGFDEGEMIVPFGNFVRTAGSWYDGVPYEEALLAYSLALNHIYVELRSNVYVAKDYDSDISVSGETLEEVVEKLLKFFGE